MSAIRVANTLSAVGESVRRIDRRIEVHLADAHATFVPQIGERAPTSVEPSVRAFTLQPNGKQNTHTEKNDMDGCDAVSAAASWLVANN
ncbi:unnamed protein product [Toxocara canis]|uniref:Cysteine protease n=1 Tax=Toxocara canis TaxID=6265 RepID=A0A183UTG1_TOXCA|nr:unnamed protein product [Toxocara canis]